MLLPKIYFKMRTVLGVFGFALLAGGAVAQTPMSYTENGKPMFRVDVPDFWEARVGGPRLLTPVGEDAEHEVARVMGLQPEAADNIWVGFIVPQGVRSLEEGADYVREIGPHLMKGTEVTKREVRRIGGRTAHSISGHGRRKGKSVQFTAVLIDLPGPHIAFSVTILENGFDPELLDGINSIYASFKAVQ